MLAPWVVDETKDADLRDKRLNDRLQRILSDLSERPTASIPAACGGKAETEAAYDTDQEFRASCDRLERASSSLLLFMSPFYAQL